MSIPLPSLSDISNMVALLAIPLAAWGTALWLGLVIWTFKDMRARSRDPFAQIMASVMVAVLMIPGWLIYLMLRPRESLIEAYERALEQEALLQQIEERPSCPGCFRPTLDDWGICPYCGTRLRKGCPGCDRQLELHWNLCPYCGTPSGPTPAGLAAVDADAPTPTNPADQETSEADPP